MTAPGGSITLLTPAKLNLYLRIGEKRKDGFHEMLMFNAAVDLCDTLELRKCEEPGIKISCDAPDVPTDGRNLCHKAALFFFRKFPAAETGLEILIKKKIPAAGGLGGGSGNAAGTLVGLMHFFGIEPAPDDLIEMGLAVGADVPFFLFGSPAWARGAGEILDPAAPLPDWTFLVAGFDFGVSTAWAFSQWDLTSNRKKVTLNYPAGDVAPPITGLWHNDFERLVKARYPEVGKVKDFMLEKGATGAMMSGSGPTVFGAYEDKKSAEAASRALEKMFAVKSFTVKSLAGPVIRVVL